MEKHICQADYLLLKPFLSFTAGKVNEKMRSFMHSCLERKEAHVLCLTFTFQRLATFVIVNWGGPVGVANNLFDK